MPRCKASPLAFEHNRVPTTLPLKKNPPCVREAPPDVCLHPEPAKIPLTALRGRERPLNATKVDGHATGRLRYWVQARPDSLMRAP